MRAFKTFAVLIAVSMVLPVFADVVEEAGALAHAGVSEEVQLAWASRQNVALTAQDIIALKECGVSSNVIVVLIRNGSTRIARQTPRVAAEPTPATYVPAAAAPCVQPATVTYVDPAPATYVSYSPYYYSYPYWGYYSSCGYYPYYSSYYRPSFSLGFSFFGGYGYGGHSYGGSGGFAHHH